VSEVTESELIEFGAGLPGTVIVTASEENGAPESAWGDSFFFYDPDSAPENRKMAYATIVVTDYEGFDSASKLNRPEVFRLNIAVGRAAFERLLGYPPAAHPEHTDGVDYAAADRILPHPVYAAQSWIAIVNPGDATAAQARGLLREAHARAARRHTRG
jgi:hypothetical protein